MALPWSQSHKQGYNGSTVQALSLKFSQLPWSFYANGPTETPKICFLEPFTKADDPVVHPALYGLKETERQFSEGKPAEWVLSEQKQQMSVAES